MARSIAMIAIIGEISIIPIRGVILLKNPITGSVTSRMNKKNTPDLSVFNHENTTRMIIAKERS